MEQNRRFRVQETDAERSTRHTKDSTHLGSVSPASAPSQDFELEDDLGRREGEYFRGSDGSAVPGWS